MKGPDACGRVLERAVVEQLLRAGLNLWDWSDGQITQQHGDVARAFQRDGGKR